MNKCKLCNKNDADKKGSHIVPHFLLKRIENIEGKKGRDYELGFTLEKLKSSSYFGRAVQPEKLEDIYGKISDKDIENNLHPLVVDNFFCSKCENRLAVIESEYAKTIETIKKGLYKSGVDSFIGILFWGSILWRMSINGKSGVKLTVKQNEHLRKILDDFLQSKIDELDIDSMKENDLIKSISYKLLRCNDCREDDEKWLIFHPEFDSPLCLLIDEFVLAFSLSNNFQDLEKIDLFGVSDIVNKTVINKVCEDEKINSFDNKIYKMISSAVVEKMKSVYLDGLSNFLDLAHKAAGGIEKTMPSEIKEEILDEITSEQEKLGRRYTQANVIKSTLKIIRKYQSL